MKIHTFEQGREPTTNSTHIEPRPHWWEASALTTAPSLLLTVKVHFINKSKVILGLLATNKENQENSIGNLGSQTPVIPSRIFGTLSSFPVGTERRKIPHYFTFLPFQVSYQR